MSNPSRNMVKASGNRGGGSDEAGSDPDLLMVQSVEKAFRVLNAIGNSGTPCTLAEVTAKTQIGKSAAQRFMHTLAKLGYIERFQNTNSWVLSVKVLQLTNFYLNSNEFIRRTQPYLIHLSKETEETVNLTILEGTDIVFISRYPSRHVLATDVVIGTRMPAYCSAPGIAMLSRLNPEAAEDVINASSLKAFTQHTTCDRDALLQKIAVSAKRGYSTAFEEYFLGDISIASAIIDSTGAPVGAINVAVSRARYTPEEAEARFSGAVAAAAQAASSHRPPAAMMA
ncbi:MULTISPECIES: IclR family transcriptional regulator [unclassified Hwanghaeella]|uniref:IclR family transcriptional regulator n=1 Tax=unclassified Hwanghaeella TaxID=2605944 RepID=UPI003B674CD7